MTTFAISLFSCAADNEPTLAEIPKAEVFEHLSEREVLPDDGLDSQQALKTSGAAWSPSTFRGTRADANVISASLLVFDFDKDVDKLPGVTNESLGRLRSALNALDCRWMLCSTFSSGFVAPRHKLRAVLPLERPVSVQEYTDLWDAISTRLPVKPDSTRRHPGGIFFTPRVFESHLPHWVFECRNDAQDLKLQKLESKIQSKKIAPEVSGSTFRSFGVSTATVGVKDWVEHVATAEEKHHALNAAAFALAAAAHERARPRAELAADLWPRLEAALKRNPGQPVKDWRAAERTVLRAIDDAYAKPLPEADPLKAPLPETLPVTPQLAARAQKQLEKWERRVKKNPELPEVTNAAAWLGKFCPHVFAAEHVTACLRSAARNGRSQASDTDLTTAIDVGLAKGMRSPEGQLESWAEGLAVGEDGFPLATDENLAKIFARHPDVIGVLGYDVRADCVSVRREPPWETIDTHWPAPFRECEAVAVATWLCSLLTRCKTVGADKAYKAVVAHAGLTEYDEFKEYLESLSWDETPRLDTWLSTYVGAPDNAYTRAVGAKWILSAVARTFRPGCQVDTALILQGPQGIGKSSAFVALVPDEKFILQNMPNLNDKDIHVAMGRYVISEMAELTAISRKDVNHVKEFITIRTGKVRKAFARAAVEIPRRGILGGSTNAPGEFLTDVTGGRRFWIVRCTSPDVTGLSEARDQLWAEAVARYAAGAKWYLDRDEEKLAAEQADQHTEKDDLLEVLQDMMDNGIPGNLVGPYEQRHAPQDDRQKFFPYPGQLPADGKPLFMLTRQACALLGLNPSKDPDCKRTCRLFEQLGYKKVQKRTGDHRAMVWVRGESPQVS